MAWARMDDGFHDHPKVGGLSLAAVGLWTLCFTWCNRHLGADDLPPGFVPTHQPKRFGGTTRQVAELVAAGLWETTDGGWLFHDFEDYLPESRRPSNMAEVSAARSEAGKRGAAKRWHPDDNTDGKLPSDDSTDNRKAGHEEVTADEVGAHTAMEGRVENNPSESSQRRSERFADGKLLSDPDGKPMAPVPSRTQESSSDEELSTSRPELLALCEHLADRIEANGTPRPRIGKRWLTSARLLVDVDGRTPEQIHAAIDWCQSDYFWRANILSMPKLREKYDQLRLSAARAPGDPLRRPSTTDQRVADGLALAQRYADLDGTPLPTIGATP